jgi:hypothetical protein
VTAVEETPVKPVDAEEVAMIEERMKDYYADPSSFVPLADVK